MGDLDQAFPELKEQNLFPWKTTNDLGIQMHFLARIAGAAAAYATDPLLWFFAATALIVSVALRRWWWTLLIFPLAVIAYRISADFIISRQLAFRGLLAESESAYITLTKWSACALLGLVLALFLLLVRWLVKVSRS